MPSEPGRSVEPDRPAAWRPLRIAMIGQKGLPATYGGVERHVEELGARLSDRGHLVTAFSRAGYAGLHAGAHRGVSIRGSWTLPTKHLDATVHSLTATALAMRDNFDVVHYHGLGPAVMAVLPRYLGGPPVVLTVHALDHERAKWRGPARAALCAAHWLSARVPDRTVVVSRTLQDHYAERFRRRVDYITNGMPTVRTLAPQHIRELYGLSEGSYLLYVGRLVPEKAPDLLLRAYARVPGDRRLVIAGGSSFSNDYVRRLRTLAEQDPRVLLVGYIYGETLAELYSNAAAFVLPSHVEGLPLTLLEALAYGRPVIASDIGPHLEVLGAGGGDCRIFPDGDEASLAAALADSLGGSAEIRLSPGLEQVYANIRADAGTGAGILERVRALYSWDTAADLLERVYLELAGRSARSDVDVMA